MRRTEHTDRSPSASLLPRSVAIAVACLLFLAGCASGGSGTAGETRYDGLAVPESQLREVPDMVLADTEGNDFHLAADTAGQVRLIYQMFTNCPDICGVQLAQLASVLRRPGAPKNVQVLAVTVDPARDTPEVLRAYLDQFSDDFVGLIPDDEQQLTDLQNALGSLASIKVLDTTTTAPASATPEGEMQADDQNGGTHEGDAHDLSGDAGAGHVHTADDEDLAADDVNYDIAHDARVFAFAPNGHGYVQYPHPTRQTQFDHDLPLLAAIAPDAPRQAGL